VYFDTRLRRVEPSDIAGDLVGDAERNTMRAAYNRAQRLPERREMMQTWADYLDQLRTNSQQSGLASTVLP
jgi:hypothetical protein